MYTYIYIYIIYIYMYTYVYIYIYICMSGYTCTYLFERNGIMFMFLETYLWDSCWISSCNGLKPRHRFFFELLAWAPFSMTKSFLFRWTGPRLLELNKTVAAKPLLVVDFTGFNGTLTMKNVGILVNITDKWWLVDDYSGLYYPIYWGIQSSNTSSLVHAVGVPL